MSTPCHPFVDVARLMLRVRPVIQRIAANQPCQRRQYADKKWQKVRDSSLFTNRVPQGEHKRRVDHVRGRNIKRKTAREPESSRDDAAPAEPQATPSLVEQLFPEETKRYQEKENAARRERREIPLLPIELPATEGPPTWRKMLAPELDEDDIPPDPRKSIHYERLRRSLQATPKDTAALVLRNASRNLTEEDFRRLVPQGQHLEGWSLAQADFLKVVPGRDLRDLSRENFYYLLFSTPTAAFRYQTHVTKIARLTQQHTPISLSSPRIPPPGYLVDDIDVQSAVDSFSLIPASQKLDLRLLKRPFHPFLARMVENEGYHCVVSREGKMPVEVRFTMDGPQLGLNAIQFVMMQSGRQRGAHWSGAKNEMIDIFKWEGGNAYGDKDEGKEADEEERPKREKGGAEVGDTKELKRRLPKPVYVMGFRTERAAQSFVAHWHGRPIEGLGLKTGLEDDIPPIAQAEILW